MNGFIVQNMWIRQKDEAMGYSPKTEGTICHNCFVSRRDEGVLV